MNLIIQNDLPRGGGRGFSRNHFEARQVCADRLLNAFQVPTGGEVLAKTSSNSLRQQEQDRGRMWSAVYFAVGFPKTFSHAPPPPGLARKRGKKTRKMSGKTNILPALSLSLPQVPASTRCVLLAQSRAIESVGAGGGLRSSNCLANELLIEKPNQDV